MVLFVMVLVLGLGGFLRASYSASLCEALAQKRRRDSGAVARVRHTGGFNKVVPSG